MQLFASHGYVVFAPNYLGSDNRGNEFERAVVNGNAGDGPGRGIVAGIAARSKSRASSTNRVSAFPNGRGAANMTSGLIGHYHIWKAAVAGAAITPPSPA